jgi:membrane-associated phospholipid phosphatase
MNFDARTKWVFVRALAAFIAIMLCIQLLDLPLAAWVARYMGSHAPHLGTSDIPDLLLISVVILTSLSWMGYFYLVRLNIHDRRTLFCQVTGTVLPLSFGMKTVLKWAFGRTETRAWLSDPSLYGFHWFAGTKGLQGFPSGHMLVFTPLLLALWHFYPRYRLYYGVIWSGLGIALLVTEYHFLGDVVAGACVGVLAYLVVRRTVG